MCCFISFFIFASSIKLRMATLKCMNETWFLSGRMAVPPPPEPKRNKDYVSAETKKLDKELPKPPAVIRNLDLVANLPAQTEESEDEYEAFDGNIVEQKKMSRVDSKQSLHSGRQGSVESVYKPPSATSHEEEEEDYELYESITEGVSVYQLSVFEAYTTLYKSLTMSL